VVLLQSSSSEGLSSCSARQAPNPGDVSSRCDPSCEGKIILFGVACCSSTRVLRPNARGDLRCGRRVVVVPTPPPGLSWMRANGWPVSTNGMCIGNPADPGRDRSIRSLPSRSRSSPRRWCVFHCGKSSNPVVSATARLIGKLIPCCTSPLTRNATTLATFCALLVSRVRSCSHSSSREN